MQTEHVITLALCGLGVFHGFSLGAYLLLKASENKLSNKLLGALLVIFGLRISKSIFLYFTSDLDAMLVLLGLTLVLTFGPFFYLYVRSLLQKEFKLRKVHLVHFVPFVSFLLINTLGLVSREFYLYFGIFFIYLHFLGYVLASYIWQKKYRKNSHATLDKVALKWINFIHLGMFLVWLSYFVFLLDELIPYIAGPMTYSLVIYPLSFWAIMNKVHKQGGKKYQNSRLDNQESADIVKRLESLIEDQKAYLDPELKLPSLAVQLDTSAHVLSQVVNENFGQNFQQYLNSFRVKAAQKMLVAKEYTHLNIAAVAFDSGFNSLSAFNAAFKKVMQKTPSQYRKEQMASK